MGAWLPKLPPLSIPRGLAWEKERADGGAFFLRLCWLGANGNGPLPHLGDSYNWPGKQSQFAKNGLRETAKVLSFILPFG